MKADLQFPMAHSISKGVSESKEGGLVMHSKMLRYERAISVSLRVDQDLRQRQREQCPRSDNTGTESPAAIQTANGALSGVRKDSQG